MISRRHWRRLFRILHRDLGYLLFGVTIIYSISGLALNHMNDWNPSYVISHESYSVELSRHEGNWSREQILKILDTTGIKATYKKHYQQSKNVVRIFLKGGSATLNLTDNTLLFEWVKRRPLFFSANKLHYNPNRLWTVFSDFFAVGLIVISVTGLFILKGRHGITRRGGILVLLGLLVPGIIAYFSL